MNAKYCLLLEKVLGPRPKFFDLEVGRVNILGVTKEVEIHIKICEAKKKFITNLHV